MASDHGPDALRREPAVEHAVPQSTTAWRGVVEAISGTCAMFGPHPREGFQEPFASDVPTLAIGGTWDQKTSWKWGAEAIRESTDARAVVVPETGHGSILFADCVSNTGVALTHDHGRHVGAARAGHAPTLEIAPRAAGPFIDRAAPASDGEPAIPVDPPPGAFGRRMAGRHAATIAAAEGRDAGAGRMRPPAGPDRRPRRFRQAADLAARIEDARPRREGEPVAGRMPEPDAGTLRCACGHRRHRPAVRPQRVWRRGRCRDAGGSCRRPVGMHLRPPPRRERGGSEPARTDGEPQRRVATSRRKELDP